MRIAYIGNFEPYFSTESSWCRAFERLDHEVLRVQQRVAHESPDTTFDAIRQFDPEFLCYSRTHDATALGADWTERWREFERQGAATLGLHLDLFFGLEAEREALVTGGDPLFTMGTVFTPDGGNGERFTAAGVNHQWMVPAMDQECCYLGEPAAEYLCDVLFVGSAGYHPAYWQRPALIDAATARWGDRFLHVGPDGIGSIRGHDLNPVIASAKVVLGDSCFALDPDRNVPSYWSDRVPETLGRGGLLVHPLTSDLGYDFEEVFCSTNDIDGLLDRVDEALAAPVGWRTERGLNGYDNVLNHHTYDHRGREVLGVAKMNALRAGRP